MDVVDARTNLVRIVEIGKDIQQFHLRTGTLDGDHVSIHRSNMFDNIIKLRIAHVGVNLSLVFHAAG